MKQQNRINILPIDIQILIWEFTGEHRAKMKQVLQHLVQREYKRLIVGKICRTTCIVDTCDFCGKPKLSLATCIYQINRLHYAFICCNSCNKKYKQEYSGIYNMLNIYQN